MPIPEPSIYHTATGELAQRLSLHRAGREWRGTCPLCGYRDALVLGAGRTGRPLLWCASCQDRDGLHALLRGCGAIPAAPKIAAEQDRRERAARAGERALALWRGSIPAIGTLADRYLTARGLPGLAPALHFRADCWHAETRSRLPAMIALVSDAAGRGAAVHRTWLRRDGSAKADVAPPRKTLGSLWGGAVRLDSVADEIVIGEGIETSASAGRLLGLPAWAAISAGNLARGVVLPPEVRAVTIAADADEPGRKAANAAWFRWTAEGRSVCIATPDKIGSDCNDVLIARRAQEAA